MVAITIKDVICLIVVVVSLVNSQLHQRMMMFPKHFRWIPWFITITTIILLILAFIGHSSSTVLFTIGSKN